MHGLRTSVSRSVAWSCLALALLFVVGPLRAAAQGGEPSRLLLTAVPFQDLPGWSEERPTEMLAPLLANCVAIRAQRDRPLGGEALVAERAGSAAAWAETCDALRDLPRRLPRLVASNGSRAGERRAAAARGAREAAMRAFLERHFTAHAAGTGVMTGYYEPVLRGATTPSGAFATPLLARPPELGERGLVLAGGRGARAPDRAAIETGAYAGRGLEIAWVDDPADAFFLHIQGSGRVMMPDGTMMRVGYAGQNGHAFIGLHGVLVQHAGMPRQAGSMQAMRAWLQGIGAERAAEMMRRNPSYVFFRRVEGLAPDQGPVGAMGVPLTPRRSVAVDRTHIPLGLPLFIAARDPVDRQPFGRLVLAQDTGGAIRGPTRTDYFWGWGDEAGERAGRTHEEARVFLLLPRSLPEEQRLEVAAVRR